MGYLVPVLDWLWTAAIVVARVSRPVNLAVSARLKTALESRPTSRAESSTGTTWGTGEGFVCLGANWRGSRG